MVSKKSVPWKFRCVKRLGACKRLCRGTVANASTKKPDDFVIATGKQYSVRDFIKEVSKNLDMQIEWRGQNLDEVGLYEGKDIIKIDPRYFRPT